MLRYTRPNRLAWTTKLLRLGAELVEMFPFFTVHNEVLYSVFDGLCVTYLFDIQHMRLVQQRSYGWPTL